MCENPTYTTEVTVGDCDNFGYTTYTCTECGYSYKADYTLHVHVFDEGMVKTEPTVESEGVKVYTCENCGYTKEESIPKLEPEEPTAPAVTGIEDGQEFDLGKGEKPAPTWEPEDATATLNGKPYTAGTEIAEAGDYTLVVTDADGNATTINFKVTDSSATNPDQPNTSDLPVAGIAIVSLIAAAAVVVIARKKRFAR